MLRCNTIKQNRKYKLKYLQFITKIVRGKKSSKLCGQSAGIINVCAGCTHGYWIAGCTHGYRITGCTHGYRITCCNIVTG